jgi:hypothetical protein
VPALTGDVLPSSHPRRPFRLHLTRRRLAGIAAGGVTAAVLVAGAVTGASAAPAAAASPRVVTLTSSSSAPTGHLTVTFRYGVGRPGKMRPLSVSYAGGSSLHLRNAALIFTVRPALGLPILPAKRLPKSCKSKGFASRCAPFFAYSLIVRVRDVHSFSGTVRLPRIAVGITKVTKGKVKFRPLPLAGGPVLVVTLASVPRAHGKQKPVAISAPIGMQVGILLGPTAP